MREQDKQPCLFLYKLQHCKRHVFLEKMRTKMYWAAIALNSECFAYNILFNPHNDPSGQVLLSLFLQKMKPSIKDVTCSNSRGQSTATPP